MKKISLALVVASTFLTTTAHAAEIYNKNANKLDLYGRVKAMRYISDNKSVDGDQTYARLGFKGETQINDLLTGYGQWEYQITGNKTESDGSAKTRMAFAGLKAGDYGSFDYGRNYGVLYDVEAWTDIFPEFGGDGWTRTDNFMTGRTNGVATYRNRDFFGLVDGLNVAVQYQGKNENDGRAVSKQNGDGVGGAVTYDFGDSGFSVGATYAAANRTAAQKAQNWGRGDKAEAWATGLKYSANGLYLGAVYAETRNMTPISGTAMIDDASTSVSGFANKMQTFEAVVQYQFNNGLRPSLGYVQSKGKKIEGVGNADLVKYVDVAATYYFNKNMSAFVDYKINLVSDNNPLALNTDNVVATGLTYQF